jgi:hypothetical protein
VASVDAIPVPADATRVTTSVRFSMPAAGVTFDPAARTVPVKQLE